MRGMIAGGRHFDSPSGGVISHAALVARQMGRAVMRLRRGCIAD